MVVTKRPQFLVKIIHAVRMRLVCCLASFLLTLL